MRISGLILSLLVVGATASSAQQQANPPSPAARISSPSAGSDTVSIRAKPDALGPRTLTAAMVACTDLPVMSAPTSPWRILAAHSGTFHQSYRPGEIVVLNTTTAEGFVPGQRFFVRRLQLGLTGDPPSPDTPGAVRTAGWLTVIAADQHSTLAMIDFACDALVAGDYLEPFTDPTLPGLVMPDGPTDWQNLGKVMFGADRRTSFGNGDLLNIEIGQARLALGSHVSFHRDRRNWTPLVEMAVGVIVEVTGSTAKAVVTKVREEVRIGDFVAVRGPVTQ
jgi:hypothetical protein